MSGKKRPTYSLDDHKKVVEQVRAYQADPENGPVSDGAACASIGVSFNRFKYAQNVLAAHEKKVARGEAAPLETNDEEVAELPLEKPNRLTAIDEVRAEQAEETEEDDAGDEEEELELEAAEFAGPELEGVRVYVIEGTVAAVAELLARGFK